jgi:hypothetical protein
MSGFGSVNFVGERGAACEMTRVNPFVQTLMHSMRRLLLPCVIAGLAACSDDGEPAAPQHAPPVPVAQQADHQLEWLKQTDGLLPEQWLASREAGLELDRFDDRVSEMHAVLQVAAMRFRDHPRMIANRAVQLETMLREKKIEERAPRLIVTLSQVPGKQRYVESFASLTQQYYNLRTSGLSRGEATDALRRQVAPGQ